MEKNDQFGHFFKNIERMTIDQYIGGLQQQSSNNNLNRKTHDGLHQMKSTTEIDKKFFEWNLRLDDDDDQDEISEYFLKINEKPLPTEKFGPVVSTVPDDIRKQADDLFKPSDINASDIFNWSDAKVSWAIQNGYNQYLKSIPKNELAKREHHVMYPWTQWETSTETHHRSSSSTGTTAVFEGQQQQPLTRLTPQKQYFFKPDSRARAAATNPGGSPTAMSSSESAAAAADTTSSSSSYPSGDNLLAHSSPLSSSLLSYWNSDETPSGGDGSSQSITSDGLILFDTPVQPPPPPPPLVLDSFTGTTSSSSSSSLSSRFLSQNNNNNNNNITSSRSADYYSPSPPPAASNLSHYTPSRLYDRFSSDGMVHSQIGHYCTFCYKNHEPPEVYGTHLVRDAVRITCPKLRALRCKHCKGTGDFAHTIKYCPFLYSNYK